MRRQDPECIGDVLRSVIDDSCMAARLDESKARSLWARIVGPDIASQCGSPTMRGGLMTIGVKSAALRQELQMSRSSIVRLINSSLGKQVVADIRFIS